MNDDEWAGFTPIDGRTPEGAKTIIEGLGGRVTSTKRPTWIKDEVPGGPQSQERLYNLYKVGKGNLAAPPGSSAHETDDAIDFVGVDPMIAADHGVHFKKSFWENDHTHAVVDRPQDDWGGFTPVAAPKETFNNNSAPVDTTADNWEGFNPVPAKAAAGMVSDPHNKVPLNRGFWDRFVDNYKNGTETGLVGYGIRRLSDWMDLGKPDKLPPGMTPEQAEKIHDMAITQLSRQRRADFAAKEQADPNNSFGDYAAALLGNILGGADPTYLVGGPEGKGALAVLKRIGTQALVNGGTDAATQGLQIHEGTQDKFNPNEVALNAAAGAAFQGAGEVLSHGLGRGAGDVDVRDPNAPEPTISRGEGDVQVDLPNADPHATDAGLAEYFEKVPRDAGDKPLIPYEDWKQGQREVFNDPNDHTKPAIGDVPEAPPLTSRESFDDTSALMERYEAEKLPNESREDFVRRKTAEEFAPTPEDATGNVANDVANTTDLRTTLGDRRIAPREDAVDRRAEPAPPPTPSPATYEDLSGKTDVKHDVDEYTTDQVRELIAQRLAERRGEPAAPVETTPIEEPHPVTGHYRSDIERYLGDGPFPKGFIEQVMEIPDHIGTPEFNDKSAFLAKRFGYEAKPQDLSGGMDVFDEHGNPTKAFTAVMDGGANDNVHLEGPVIDPERLYQEANGAGGGKGGGGGEEPPELPPEPPEGGTPGESPKKGFAGNLNLDRIDNTKEVDQLYRDLSTAMPTNADRAQGRAATEDLAKILGKKSAEELIAHNPKLSESPQYAVALRNGLKVLGDRFVSLAKRIAEGDNRPEVLQHFLLTQARMAALMERTMEVTGVGGRLLDSFNIRAKGGTDYKDLFKGMPNDLWSNPDNAKKLAELVAEHADNPAAAARIARDSLKPGFADYGFSLWYNWGLLSNPATQAANIFSNTSMNLVNLATHGLAFAIGAVRTGFSKNADRVFGREVAARMYATGKAMAVAGPNMKTAFVEGAPLDQVMRMERPTSFTGKTGMVLEAPTRMMAAQDEFFRTVASLQELYGLSMRQAVKEGHTGQKLLDRADEIAANPSDDMMKKANEAGLIMRFQDKSSGIGRMIEGMRSIHPGDNLAVRSAKNTLRLFIPFLRTTDSLIRTTLRYSPLGVLDRYNLAGLKAGGAERDLAVARLSMGSALTAYAYLKAMNGDITGEGPPDMRARQQLEATGWQANSIKVGDKYINIKGYEPFSTNLTGIATLVEQDGFKKLDDQSAAKSALSHTLDMVKMLNSNSWGQSVTDMLDLLDPRSGDAKSDNTASGLVSSLTTPAALRAVNQNYIDPVKRDTRGDGSLGGRIEGRIEAGIPGMSDKLPASYDVYGREQMNPDAIGPDMLSRLNVKESDPSPVSHEVERLSKAAGNKVLVGPPGTTLQGKRIPPPVYEQYQKISGGYIHSYLEGLMQSPDWARMSDDEKIAEIKGTVTDARAQAREELGLVKED